MAERALARKEARSRRMVAREKAEHVGRVSRWASLQRDVEKVVTKICTPLMKRTVKTLQKQLTMRKMCKHGVSKEERENEQWPMDSGAAGHAMFEAMFPRVKLERKTSPKRFCCSG